MPEQFRTRRRRRSLSHFTSTISFEWIEMITMNPENDRIVSKKPPLPPRRSSEKPTQITKSFNENTKKRKICEENIQRIQRLTAFNDRLNNDISDLRRLLQNEKLAVRELRWQILFCTGKSIYLLLFLLRASHESEYRKLKHETKKHLKILGNAKNASTSKQLLDSGKFSEEVAIVKDDKNSNEKKLRSTAATASVKVEINKLVSDCTIYNQRNCFILFLSFFCRLMNWRRKIIK